MATEYRVREARVEVCNGYRCWHERMFIAERRVTLFGVKLWWFPVIDGEWRADAYSALQDAGRDFDLRLPLASPEIFRVKSEVSLNGY